MRLKEKFKLALRADFEIFHIQKRSYDFFTKIFFRDFLNLFNREIKIAALSKFAKRRKSSNSSVLDARKGY